ncbi:hypothetical protein [Thermococcus sp.]|uniref:hypothetical protein n=1 Tax=Thermococcus sp. TaxID=35749 RepID=UPI0025E47C30|nr:hypothetical protein [Thermococcus sp.]
MTVGVGRVENARYDVGFDEYVIPVRGFLLQRGKLAGIYVKEGIIPVTEELPKEVHRAVVKGRVKNEITVREIHYREEDTIEVLIEADYQSWTVFTTG